MNELEEILQNWLNSEPGVKSRMKKKKLKLMVWLRYGNADANDVNVNGFGLGALEKTNENWSLDLEEPKKVVFKNCWLWKEVKNTYETNIIIINEFML